MIRSIVPFTPRTLSHIDIPMGCHSERSEESTCDPRRTHGFFAALRMTTRHPNMKFVSLPLSSAFGGLLLSVAALLPLAAIAETQAPLVFAFGAEASTPNATVVTPDMTFTKERGFGFEPGATVTAGTRS